MAFWDLIESNKEERRRRAYHTRLLGRVANGRNSGDATPCRMTGVTLHSHVRYKASLYTGLYPQSLSEEHVRPVHHQLFLEPLHHGTYSCQSFVLLADYVPNRSAEESKGRTPVRPLSS